MKAWILSLVFLTTFAQAASQKFYLSSDIFKGPKVPFQPHSGIGPYDSYLIMNLKFGPASDVYKQLISAINVPLKNRGEAHITVITPVEYNNILKDKLTMKEIDGVAKKLNIQDSKFEAVCVGKGALQIDSKTEETYYIVVRSPELLKIRQEVQKMFVAKGGDKDEFRADYFFPHITLGFTQRDLHLEDGVVKDESSCFGDVEIKK